MIIEVLSPFLLGKFFTVELLSPPTCVTLSGLPWLLNVRTRADAVLSGRHFTADVSNSRNCVYSVFA